MKILEKVALVFVIIGALNWGLIGIFDFNLVTFLFGDMTILSRIVYIIIGICGIVDIFMLFDDMK